MKIKEQRANRVLKTNFMKIRIIFSIKFEIKTRFNKPSKSAV